MNIDYDQEKWGVLSLKHLILENQGYIVFIDNNNDIDWITTDEYDTKGHEKPEKHNEILNSVALLESKPLMHLSESNLLSFKRLLGESLARSLAHDYKKALEILDHAETHLIDRGKELSRQWYLAKAGQVTALILCIGAILWVFRGFFVELLGSTFFGSCLSMVSGALGALLSIIFRMGKESLDCLSGKVLHELESTYRIIAGSLSALLISMLVRSEMFLPVFSKTNKTEIAIIALGFIAGMSERFAPSILAKLEKNDKKRGITIG